MTNSPFGQTSIRFKPDRNAQEIPGNVIIVCLYPHPLTTDGQDRVPTMTIE